jgi:hypothetical protein
MFNLSIQPSHERGYQVLNHLGISDVQDYVPGVYCGVKSANPITYDAARGMHIEYDRPSRSANISYPTMYEDFDHYTPYDVNNGQIQYYVDNSIKDAYYEPVFDMPSRVIAYDYVDPMGTHKPQYERKIPQCVINSYSCLSSINDSTFHREDIMARQQATHNQERSTPFF